MIVIINGAPGSGKTKTAEYLFEKTINSAWIDGDVMLGINPQNRTDKELELRERNIASVVKNYNQYGYKTIYISFVYMSSNYLANQIDLLKNIDDIKVISLIVDDDILKERHINDNYKRVSIESSLEINQKIKDMNECEFIDNSNMTIEEVGAYIMNKLDIRKTT